MEHNIFLLPIYSEILFYILRYFFLSSVHRLCHRAATLAKTRIGKDTCMTLLSRLLSKRAHLPPAETPDVHVERDLKATMPDGVVLLADHYSPRGVEKPPLLLVRSPYGRRGIFGLVYGQLFAERGFQV